MPRWRVDIIGKRLQHIGTVDAANEREAIEAAVNRVEPALRNKLVVTKVKLKQEAPDQRGAGPGFSS